MSALPAEKMPTNGTEFVSWRHCDVHTRSTFNILSLCLSTLVICVWNAVHPDVPYPETPRWKVYLTRFYGFLIGLFLPEVLVLNALNQFLAARQFMQKMNGVQSESFFTVYYWTQLLNGMYPGPLTMAYWTEAWRPNVTKGPERSQWTMTRAFYAVTGGFLAKSNSNQVTHLSRNLRELALLCKVDSMQSFFAADGLDDHSKAGALAKALFCWQLLVFAISCIARRSEHLPLSLLEITTLAHSLCGLVAFTLWWNKSHSVDEVVVVPVDNSLHWGIEWTKSCPPQLNALAGVTIVLYDDEGLVRAALSSLAVAALYGLPHLLALSTEFPTLAERRCWQVATAIITSTPVFLVALNWILIKRGGPVQIIALVLVVALLVVYCTASCFIVAESFRQLFALPSGAFVAPALVCYLPHFS